GRRLAAGLALAVVGDAEQAAEAHRAGEVQDDGHVARAVDRRGRGGGGEGGLAEHAGEEGLAVIGDRGPGQRPVVGGVPGQLGGELALGVVVGVRAELDGHVAALVAAGAGGGGGAAGHVGREDDVAGGGVDAGLGGGGHVVVRVRVAVERAGRGHGGGGGGGLGLRPRHRPHAQADPQRHGGA